MQIEVLFDKDAQDKNLLTGWGVSFLVNERILFDTGEKGDWLLENMKNLNVDIGKIEAIVISHDHWDHTGGLWEILKKRKGIKVYACPHFSKEFKEKVSNLQGELIEADKFREISGNIFITGEIPGTYYGKYMAEQAVVLKTANGITVITGCAHPGILKMTEEAKAKFPGQPIYLVLGGFHLMESDKQAIEIVIENFKKMGIIKSGPTHCTGQAAIELFRKEYKDNFVEVEAGRIIEI